MTKTSLSLMLVALLAIGQLAIPISLAQDGAGLASADDPEGDVAYQASNEFSALGGEDEASKSVVDLVQVIIGPDTPTDLPIKLTYVTPASGASQNPENERAGRITFTADGAEYYVQTNEDPCERFALFEVIEGSNPDRLVVCVDSTYDANENTLELTVSKSSIRQQTGAPIAPGDMLVDIQGVSWSGSSPNGMPTPGENNEGPYTLYYDYAPDVKGSEFQSNAGGASSSNPGFSVSVVSPVRATNGAEATFRYDVVLTNTRGMSHDLEVSVSDTWDGTDSAVHSSIDATGPPRCG